MSKTISMSELVKLNGNQLTQLRKLMAKNGSQTRQQLVVWLKELDDRKLVATEKTVHIPVKELARWVDLATYVFMSLGDLAPQKLVDKSRDLYMSIMAPLPTEGYKMLHQYKYVHGKIRETTCGASAAEATGVCGFVGTSKKVRVKPRSMAKRAGV